MQPGACSIHKRVSAIAETTVLLPRQHPQVLVIHVMNMMMHCISLTAYVAAHRYENIIQIRCLYEGVTVEDMLANWGTMLPSCMQKWGLERNEVSAA